jgi:uncharacterized protein (DUF1501 family)
MSNSSRRQFIKTTGTVSLAATAMGPKLAFGAEDEYSDNILVFIFQRGGIDGLSFLAPMDGHADRGNYETLRSNGTMIPSTDLQLLANGWGLHPSAAPLVDLWTNNSLALVQAVGLPWANRSHFEAERYVELGTPGNRFTLTGWLTRHFQSASNLPESMILPVVITESTVRLSLLGEPSAVTLRYPTSFDFDTGSSNYEEQQESILADIYALESGELDIAGTQALKAMELVEAIDFENYTPANGAAYPVLPDDPTRLTSFGEELKIMAQLIKEDAGVRICATDIGGWDTHNDQGNAAGGVFHENVRDLSESLLAFFTDLDVPSPNGDNWSDRVTCIVASEFGRRAYDNADAGTDHGWGNNMLVMGGGVNGGQLYGDWPGLDEEALFQGADVHSTTDYRTIFTEILLKRLNNDQVYQVFPGYTAAEYKPLGVVSGSPVKGDFNDTIFKDGLE